MRINDTHGFFLVWYWNHHKNNLLVISSLKSDCRDLWHDVPDVSPNHKCSRFQNFRITHERIAVYFLLFSIKFAIQGPFLIHKQRSKWQFVFSQDTLKEFHFKTVIYCFSSFVFVMISALNECVPFHSPSFVARKYVVTIHCFFAFTPFQSPQVISIPAIFIPFQFHEYEIKVMSYSVLRIFYKSQWFNDWKD